MRGHSPLTLSSPLGQEHLRYLEYLTPAIALKVDLLWGTIFVNKTVICYSGWPNRNGMSHTGMWKLGLWHGSLSCSLANSLPQPALQSARINRMSGKITDCHMSSIVETLEITNFKSITAKDQLHKWVNFSQFLFPN